MNDSEEREPAGSTPPITPVANQAQAPTSSNNPAPPPPPPVPSARSRNGGASHHAYAQQTLQYFTVKEWKPVYHQGDLFVLNETTTIWEPVEQPVLIRTVAELCDGKAHCKQRSDYVGIAAQMCSIASDSSVFEHAPDGVACAGSFYRVSADKLLIEPLDPGHRQRVMLPFEPQEQPTPLFNQFLHETFRSDSPGEEMEQCERAQEIAGAVLLGLMPRYQKAVLFYDPYGRAGKGTLERIIGQLVPPRFTTAVSPFNWDREYHLANLIGSRLNVVGELPDGQSIPAAAFKSVLGTDLLSARQPAQPVVTFRNEAAHIFTSNHLIATRDQTAAFFSRWLLLDFPNSLLKSGRPVDPGLCERIISAELPGIGYWALQGAMRLLAQGHFSSSAAHDRLMAKWRRSSNSLDEFMEECCEVVEGVRERRSAFYVYYRNWCKDNGRKPYSKSKVKELMETRVGLEVRFALLDGYETVHGIRVREDYRDNQNSI